VRHWSRISIVIILILLPVAVFAQDSMQDPPTATEEPQPPPIVVQTVAPTESGPPVDTANLTPVVTSSGPPGLATPIPDVAIVEETPEPEPEVIVVDDSVPVLIRVRADLEALASETYGLGQRPEGWSGSIDTNDPQMGLLARLDLEILSGLIHSATERPAGWFGAVASTPFAIARDVRHDMELLADTVLGFNVRPSAWQGDEPLMRCNRATQSLVGLLLQGGVFSVTIETTSPTFCGEVEIQASQFVETVLLANPQFTGDLTTTTNVVTTGGSADVNSEFAIAFLDRNAYGRVGVVPNGSSFTPIGRSYAQFSNMMLIQGDNYIVFVDFQFTSVTEEVFRALPDVDGIGSEPFCSAGWCSGS